MAYIAWPLAAVIIAVVFMAKFNKPIGRLVHRTRKIGTTGLDATAVAQETSMERVPSGAEQLLARFDNELLVEQENAIKASTSTTIGLIFPRSVNRYL